VPGAIIRTARGGCARGARGTEESVDSAGARSESGAVAGELRVWSWVDAAPVPTQVHLRVTQNVKRRRVRRFLSLSLCSTAATV
jgi:hypothetical protein